MNFKPGLYIVSTPIGNLEDITFRAINALKASNIIICEDTRVSSKLLAKYDIKKSLMVYNDASCEKTRANILNLIDQGNIVSLISDAGTPLISDPGYKLIRELKEKNYHIDVIPGVCSPIAALTISGLATDRFLFAGFLPKTENSKIKTLENLSTIKSTLIFFESANRLVATLKVAKFVLGDRESSVARELTKLHQESKTQKLSALVDYYSQNLPKGEVVLLISGNLSQEIENIDVIGEIDKLLKAGLTAKSVTDFLIVKYQDKYSRKGLYMLVNEQKSSLM